MTFFSCRRRVRRVQVDPRFVHLIKSTLTIIRIKNRKNRSRYVFATLYHGCIIALVGLHPIRLHLHTCAQHPEPINASSSNLMNKSRQDGPYVFSSRRFVYCQECIIVFCWSCESVSQTSRENISRRVDIHWPNLMKIGPRDSIPAEITISIFLFSTKRNRKKGKKIQSCCTCHYVIIVDGQFK